MNKGDLVEQIAQAAEISKSAAERAVDALVGAVKTSLRKDEMVTLVGFGTFYAGRRQARTGRNPRTGEALDIKAARLPKFRAGKALKDAINWRPSEIHGDSPVDSEGCLAQLVERRSYTANVGGSIPSAPTTQQKER